MGGLSAGPMGSNKGLALVEASICVPPVEVLGVDIVAWSQPFHGLLVQDLGIVPRFARGYLIVRDDVPGVGGLECGLSPATLTK